MSSSLLNILTLSLLFTSAFGHTMDWHQRFNIFVRQTNISPDPRHVEILMRSDTDSYIYLCSGTLFSKGFILTGLPCAMRIEVENIRALAYVYNKRSREFFMCDVKKIIFPAHDDESYIESDYFLDYAMLRFECAITVNNRIAAIPRNGYNVRPGSLGIVTDWQINKPDKQPGMHLKPSKEKILDNAECKQYYCVQECEFCAGDPKKDSTRVNCSDSVGNALVVNNVLVGIRICGNGGEHPKSLNIYSDVSCVNSSSNRRTGFLLHELWNVH